MATSGIAFDRLESVGPDYARSPIGAAISWDACADVAASGAWYLVVFRSVRRADVDEAHLWAVDDRAHHEAMGADGFVHYFKGPLEADRSCLSFCLWDSRDAARSAARLPAHLAAVAILAEAYERYALEFYRVTKQAGRPFAFEPYDRVPVDDGEMRPAA